MIHKDKVLVCDVDGTITVIKDKQESCSDLKPIQSVVGRLIKLKS